MSDRRWRPGRDQDAGREQGAGKDAGADHPKGTPGRKPLTARLPGRTRRPAPRTLARTDATEGNAARLHGRKDWAHDPHMLAAHGFPPAVQAREHFAAQTPPGHQPAQDVDRDAADAALPGALALGPAAEHSSDAEIVQVQAGEVLTVQASAAEAVEVVIAAADGTIVARQAGDVVRLSHVAASSGTLAVRARVPGAAGPGATAPSAQLMVAVEPAGSAESTGEDGAASLNARQHLLLNLFGVTPRALHPGTGLALAEALDALEVVARSASADAVPASAGAHQLAIQHTSAGPVEQAVYTLTGAFASLTLETVFDAGTGALRCRLVYRDVHGAELRGALQHTIALADGVPVQPAADPVGDYLASDPGQVGALDDFADLTGEGERSAEGPGSFLEGALAGDFAGNGSWSATAGQTAMGFVPVAGQIADIRDIAAAGADVLGGADGAWVRLGISVIAIVPGLDFLKGGSKAGRKALNEAASEATQGTAASGLKRVREVLSKEAAARAVAELGALAVARRELLTRWQILLMDKTLSRETLIALRKARNAMQDHLQPADLTGALRDKLGLPVRLSGSGEAWDHLDEVGGALKSLENLNQRLGRELHRIPRGSEAFARLSREMGAIKETCDRMQSFLEIR